MTERAIALDVESGVRNRADSPSALRVAEVIVTEDGSDEVFEVFELRTTA